MSAENNSQGQGNSASEQAAEWIIRHDKGLTAVEQDVFSEWLAADPSHRESFRKHARTWKQFDLLVQWCPEHSSEPNPDLLAKISMRNSSLRFRLIQVGLAAAAMLVLGLFVARTLNVQAPQNVSTESDFETSFVLLEDGSEIDYVSGTELEVAFSNTERLVTLIEGEAFFTIEKDAKRPFIVRTAETEIVALGTAFNVKKNPRSLQVLVTEGRVKMMPLNTVKDQSTLVQELGQGQITFFDQQDDKRSFNARNASIEEMHSVLAWKPAILDFESTPLPEAIDLFNRHNGTKLVIADSKLVSLEVVGSFRSNNVEGFVRLLELVFDVKVERIEGEIHIHKALS